MFAQYSPLFTSGLLSESNTPSSSRRPSVELHQKDPRESLPVDASIDSLYETPTSEEDGIFLTLAPRRRDAGNSFLSLDLAESQSMRSMSLRRKDTLASRATTHFGRTAPNSPSSAPSPISPSKHFASFSQLGSVPHPRKSLVHHSSREGLPGVKPVPSSQLPAVPRRKRPADLSITFSTCLSPLASSGSSSLHRSAYSEPSILSPISPLLSPIERSYFAFSPPTSPSAMQTSYPSVQEGLRSAPAALPLQARPSVRSTVSVRTRQVNRSAALAALEGRVERKARHRSRPSNFMSMSDDEDDVDLDESEGPSPASSSSPMTAPILTPIQPTLLEVLQEEEDVVVPQRTAPATKRVSSVPSSKTGRSRRGTLESLLSPLANFIDFGDNDGSTRSWRSFVEIS